MPGWSGTPGSVMRASAVEWVTAVTSGRSIVSSSSEDEGTGAIVEARTAVDPDAVVARVLDRAQLQHARARGGHLEHLLERDDGQLARVGHDPRVGAEDAGDVGVDLADLGPERRRQRDRGGVRAAAAERGHVGEPVETPWKPATSTILPSSSACADPVGAHVEDARLGVRGVGDDARPASRSARSPRWPRSLIAIAHSAHEIRSPGREQHVHLARMRARGETSWAIATSSSVVLPRADSTATTRVALPRARSHDPPRGARMRSASATEVPPNFMTTVSGMRVRSSRSGYAEPLQRPATAQRLAERDLVGVLEVRAHREPAREPRDRERGRRARAAPRRCRARSPRRSWSGWSRSRPRSRRRRSTRGRPARAMCRSSGSTPSIGDSAPPSTW